MSICDASIDRDTAVAGHARLTAWNKDLIAQPNTSASEAFFDLRVRDDGDEYGIALREFEKEFTNLYPDTILEVHQPVLCKRKPAGKLPRAPLEAMYIGFLAFSEIVLNEDSCLRPGQAVIWKPSVPPEIALDEGTMFTRFSVRQKR
ncbi:Hypothetical protein R9X50_00406300 [Acrodontium crateriforme]|uniref:Uncharacterized protein n=1 Tax=Acrodontium crateriforme TaxID=150365 RepID=A0AAQ3M3P1_9PEZI|nr:Hypothetical protein R9X50_00406300 [Acrodontium crateriforme]